MHSLKQNKDTMGHKGGTDIRIVYEDKWLLAIEKPSGMLSVSTGKPGDITAYTLATEYVKGSGRQCRIFVLHRLDRDTSGLLIFAKDIRTKEILQGNWQEMVTERRYTAILEGEIESEEGYIETWLRENPKTLKMQCSGSDNGGQFAVSHCRRIRRTEIEGHPYTYVEFTLETGRKNQIRAQSEWIGHPIAGDSRYGARTNPFGRLALHATALSFIHPWTGRHITLKSRLPRRLR